MLLVSTETRLLIFVVSRSNLVQHDKKEDCSLTGLTAQSADGGASFVKSMPAYSVVSLSGRGSSAFLCWLSEKAIVVYTRPSGFVVRDAPSPGS